ncbi:phage holin family protein [Clostridium tertium]|uniref:phage holin family protein n=1 Tax=Clostridium TaxID=1485 RepID=UPI00232DF3E1|nr:MULTISPECIES: phage holin family protein [Clostridium]MDB1923408.1 phage holin family protein [Clostridium tertium]MDB1930013.1 phage holin family protein [Clostridium tertium]MDU7948681.1 phage holin family protein [Clostridium sp.]
MEKTNFIKLSFTAIGAYLSAKLGILLPVLSILGFVIIADYTTGMLKARYLGEIESRKGMWGVIKKAMYAVIVAVAMVSDWIIINVAEKVGVDIPVTTFFGLLVAIWLIVNECISILENLIKMDVPMPEFLKSLVSRLKIVVEGQGNKVIDNIKGQE